MSSTLNWWTSTKITVYFVVTMAIYVNQHRKRVSNTRIVRRYILKTLFHYLYNDRPKLVKQPKMNSHPRLIYGTRVTTPFSLGTYNLRTQWKGLQVKVENHTKIDNSENKQKSKMPSLISPWLVGRKGKWVKQGHY